MKRAAVAIIDCRTPELGSHIERCDCGHVTHVKYNSCRHRSCPQCGGGRRADWLEKTTKQLLPGGVLKAVFRGKLCESLKNGLRNGKLVVPTSLTEAKCHSLINRLGRVEWNVRVQERYPHGVSVAGYLARYLVGGPISDKRLCSVSSDEIVFRYKDHRDGQE